MNKLITGLILFFFLFASTVAADQIPEKQGHVLDLAGMMTDAGLAKVEQAAGSGPFPFYVLTVERLDGADVSKYATEVYRAWGLQTGDVLLLIAQEERWVEMNFDHDGLNERIQALSDDLNGDGASGSKIDEFVSTHFVPHAAEGDFAAACIALIQAVNEFSGVSEGHRGSQSAIPKPDPGHSPVQPSDRSETGGIPSNRTPLSDNGGSGIAWFIALAVLIGGALSVWIIRGAVLHRRVAQLRTQIPELMVGVTRAAEQLQPYVGLAQGRTGKVVEETGDQLSQLLIRLNERQAELAKDRSFVLDFRKLKRTRTQYEQVLAEARDQLNVLQTEIERIVEAEKHAKRSIEQSSQHLDELREEFRRTVHNTSLPLTQLEEELLRIGEQLEQAGQLEWFDPIEALQVTERANERLMAVHESVRAVPDYVSRYNRFSDKVASARDQIRQIVESHRLKLTGIDPYAQLEAALKTNAKMFEFLQLGAMDDMRRTSAEADHLVQAAVQMTERQAKLKDQNKRDIDESERRLLEYRTRRRPMQEQELGRVRQTYAEVHWIELLHEFDRLESFIQEAESSLPNIRRWSSDDIQLFERAREQLDTVLQLLHEADEALNRMNHTVRVLDTRLESLREAVNAAWETSRQAALLLEKERLPDRTGIRDQMLNLHHMREQLLLVLSQPPYSLEEVESQARQFCHSADSIAGQIRRIAAMKQAAEARYLSIQSEYRAAANRASSRVRLRDRNHSYSAYMNQARLQIEEGLYEEAEMELNRVVQLIRQIESEYRSAIERERMEQRMQQQLARQLTNRSSSWGGGSGKGTGHGTNRSGGASWSGGSKSNRSGGSSWGSGSSRNNKSGGSKW